jgi:hypothetical protein
MTPYRWAEARDENGISMDRSDQLPYPEMERILPLKELNVGRKLKAESTHSIGVNGRISMMA